MKKQSIPILIKLLFFTFLCFSIESCCRNTEPPVLEDENMILKFECTDSLYQPIHLDLLNNIGALAKVTFKDEMIQSFSIRLKEVGKCNYYVLDSAWTLPKREDGKYFDLQLFISKSKGRADKDFSFHKDTLKKINFNPKDIIDVHIQSKGNSIHSKTKFSLNKNKKLVVEYNKSHNLTFGTQFCKSEVTINGN